ncbi:hypothetical protein K491DRAFT_699414 [Lophiostoma macrostomum CBS 122681]|uniref:Zn(2)-C6 fungal-type domain-containing protein n=1 Tax=Lophiostoma macrostomum CBS 122681 TaxID=1314788 RepID=A0A6A6SMD0_9PLEO|nr:hypothetical protein K491DRAFT_699414 [Lophiostoma macrostomum CBS 122681]
MTLRPDLNQKRTRESTSKVRSGCSTCKARRVKCDEAKPVCRRCAIGGRKCQYNAATSPSRNVITVYLPPTQCQPVIFVNDRDLDFFHRNLAGNMDGQFDKKFWGTLVLQLSHSEPAIRHAVSAITLIHRDVEASLKHPAGYVKGNPEAQQEWTTAMKNLSARIQEHPNSALVPLICCLLFTCIELFRGNTETAFIHAQSGFEILDALRPKSDTTAGSRFDLSTNDLKAIEDHVVPMFSRLNLLCTLAGRRPPYTYIPAAKEDSPHEDLADSRRRLVDSSIACLEFIDEVRHRVAEFRIELDDLVKQSKLQTRLDAWCDQLHELLERMQAAGSPANQDAVNLLLMQHKVMYIWLRVCTTTAESATDAYHADFEELVCYAEQIGAGMATPQPLSFEVQILGPLYYAVLKCRHPVIRRRALEMLRLAPRREGVWNAHYAYATAKRVIEVEEMHLNEEGLPDETSRVHGQPLPGDDSRIFSPGEMRAAFDSRQYDYNIVPSPAYPGTLAFRFYTKPFGLLGEWQSTNEYIKL